MEGIKYFIIVIHIPMSKMEDLMIERDIVIKRFSPKFAFLIYYFY